MQISLLHSKFCKRKKCKKNTQKCYTKKLKPFWLADLGHRFPVAAAQKARNHIQHLEHNCNVAAPSSRGSNSPVQRRHGRGTKPHLKPHPPLQQPPRNLSNRRKCRSNFNFEIYNLQKPAHFATVPFLRHFWPRFTKFGTNQHCLAASNGRSNSRLLFHHVDLREQRFLCSNTGFIVISLIFIHLKFYF